MMDDLVVFKFESDQNVLYSSPMRGPTLLTTTEAAQAAAVAPSTIKRWADQGVLPFARTAGGHRRFDRRVVERLLREEPASSNSTASSWVRCLVQARRHEIDGRLLEARGRLGSYWRVADELGLALAEMGSEWRCGRLSVADEHVASDALARALTRMGDALPIRVEGPTCVLACAGEDDHTLGLSLAELCLRELGWSPLWLGRRTPVGEVVRLAGGGQVAMVVLSASTFLRDQQALCAIADEVGAACKENRVALVLGGAGAWPDQPAYGDRVTSFAAFHQYLAAEGELRWA
jgi:MerR family transcriptional regulator, light-induced transcriptional regulator